MVVGIQQAGNSGKKKMTLSIFLHVVSDLDFTLVKPVVMAIGQHQLQALAKYTSALSDAFCAS